MLWIKKMAFLFVFCCVIVSCITQAEGYKVLFLPLQQASHTNLQQSIAAEMANRGHQIYTVLGSRFGAKYAEKLIKPRVNIMWFQQDSVRPYTGANIDDLFEDLLAHFSVENQRRAFNEAVDIMNEDCVDMMADAEFLTKIRDMKFDMAVIDYWHALPCLLLLPHNTSIPYLVNTVGILPWLIREPGLPSFVPWIIFQKSDKMTFYERLENMFEHFFYFNLKISARTNTTLLTTYAPDIGWWNDLLDNSLFYIHTRDHLLEWPQPTMPNNVRLFGFSFSEAKPLPKNIESLMSQSQNDIILVTFGSMGGKLPMKYVELLLQTFAETKSYTFIFSYSGDTSKLNIPPNVHIFAWLPQNDILGHNKTKLFITHAGHNGQTEAIYHGVPMINMPLYFEQLHNAFRAQEHKFGVTVNIHEFTVESLKRAIYTVLNEPEYRLNVERVSAIVKSQPHPSHVASDWIEHVIRFGSKHLRTAAFDMPWYQFFMLDIFLVFFILFHVCLAVFVCVLRQFYKYVFSGKKQKIKEQ